MKYDFETLVKRKNVGSEKWDSMVALNPQVGEDVVPLSVADMELKNAPEIVEGLKDYLDHTILGYTGATDAYYEAVQGWMERRHGFRPEKEWFVETAGVVPAIKEMVGAFTGPEDSVLITPPVYYPFKMSIEQNNRGVVESELVIRDGRYEIDFEDFERKAAMPEVKLFILCSPHNPVGRIWTEGELLRICDICLKNGVFIISDEIHFDLIMPGYEYVSMGTFEKKYLENCAICTAPSKTFNLAGFQASNIFIPNEEYRNRMAGARGYFSLNILAYKACELAYNCCEDWLAELITHLDGNRKLVEDFMAENIPQIKVFPLEGTYLQWWDCRELGMDAEELERFMQMEAQIFFDEGALFGEGGKGFERINLACPRAVLLGALKRLKKALEKRGM